MTAQILDGKLTSRRLLEGLARELEKMTSTKPKLVAVLVGENPASEVYVANKMRTAQDIGMTSELHRFPETVSEEDLRAHLHGLNADSSVTSILVQLPLPRHINSQIVLDTVAVEKDVDGFHPVNVGKLLLGMEPAALPCTPSGIIHLLDAYDIPMAGKRAAVVGRSNIVGKPMTLMLTQRDATVTLCHSRTPDLAPILREADIIVAAAGQRDLVRVEHVKPGAVIVDVGMNRRPDNGKLCGDVDFDAIKEVAGWITPVPGGVGPMTIAALMSNTMRLHKLQLGA